MSNDRASLATDPEACAQRLYRMVAHVGHPNGTFEELRLVAKTVNEKAALAIFKGCLKTCGIAPVDATLVVSEVKL